MPSNAFYVRTPENALYALSGPPKVMGMDPTVNRLSYFPHYNAQDGLVMPQWLFDMARAAKTPGNALMGRQTTPEEALNFAGNVAGAGLGSSAVMRNPAPGPGKTIAQTVYHGSPHDFDRFDMSKIGTGEGAQAYGHGLYVAESPGVARQYRDTFAVRNDASVALRTGEKLGVPSWVQQRMESGDVDSVISDFSERLRKMHEYKTESPQPWLVDGQIQSAERILKAAREFKAGNAETVPAARLYTVDLPDSAISNMLDWDAPLSQQPAVSKALDELIPKLDKDAAALLKADRKKLTGWGAHTYAVKALGSDRAASEFFKSKGIPGIRYLDGGSRGAGEGTRNFVVFDDKLLKILNKE